MIDDDSENLYSLQMLIEALGYRAYTFNSANEFFEFSNRESIDLCITDCFLGEVNGIEIIAQLSQSKPEVTCVLMSATLTQEIREKAYLSGAKHVVSKPISMDFLSKIFIDI